MDNQFQEWLPQGIRAALVPKPGGDVAYLCLKCKRTFSPLLSLYSCPDCGGLLNIVDQDFDRLLKTGPDDWRGIFDARQALSLQALRGVFLFHEFVAPNIPLEDVVYLGEANTPLVLSRELSSGFGADVYYKLDGLNPTASFKDRGMACALSHTNHLIRSHGLEGDVMAVCASTGDTSAAAALYASSLGSRVKSLVILPKGYVTAQQLSQPLGAGATVVELPGVFDDCMKVVEALASEFKVVLLNSKNPWRLLGQETYAYEVSRQFGYDVEDLTIVVPVGNGGNITAILGGFLKFHAAGVIRRLPRVVAAQSAKADPLFYFSRDGKASGGVFETVHVKPSVAQAAMIGSPVSFPRLERLIRQYSKISGPEKLAVVEVGETQILESMKEANTAGHPVCTQGGECLAALKALREKGLARSSDSFVLDSTAHFLKFVDFQNSYAEGGLEEEYGIAAREGFVNRPLSLELKGAKTPDKGRTLSASEHEEFIKRAVDEIAGIIKKSPGAHP